MLRALALLCLLGGCGARRTLRRGGCAEGTVCELDGTCRPLAESDDVRFARAVRLRPLDWASDTPGSRRSDELPIGEGSAAYFRFDVPAGRPVGAVLTLHFAPTVVDGEAELRIFLASELEGDVADRGVTPRRTGPFELARVQRAGPQRIVRLDALAALDRAGLGEEGGSVTLGVDVVGPTRAIASPRAVEDTLRPHLDLHLR
ncbi:MAG: hypothetical protein R3B99_33735 [Polyangiales bacterium]